MLASLGSLPSSQGPERRAGPPEDGRTRRRIRSDVPAAALADEAGSKYSRGWALGVGKERLVATFDASI
jgi:hypothetical protein